MKPLSFWASLPYFAIPSALMALAVYGSVPALDAAGFPLLWNFMAHFSAIFGGLGAAALFLGSRQRSPGETLAQRLWLRPLRLVDIGAGLAAGSIGLWAYIRLQVTVPVILAHMPWSGPEWLFRFRGDGALLDVPMAGAWWLLPVYAIFFLCNVVGEELWWRGYVLPRQSLAMGRAAWLPHGLMWCGFHVFFAWDLIALLPIALLLSFAAQCRRSAWAGVAGHGLLNGMNFVFIWQGITTA